MKTTARLLLTVTIVLMLFLSGCKQAEEKNRIVRIAKLQIDVSQLESYKAALIEEVETSVRVEPGVLSLYAVAEKDNPATITVFEIYANAEAYNSHIESAHFKKYKSTTREMVKSLELMEAVPIVLETKAR